MKILPGWSLEKIRAAALKTEAKYHLGQVDLPAVTPIHTRVALRAAQEHRQLTGESPFTPPSSSEDLDNIE